MRRKIRSSQSETVSLNLFVSRRITVTSHIRYKGRGRNSALIEIYTVLWNFRIKKYKIFQKKSIDKLPTKRSCSDI